MSKNIFLLFFLFCSLGFTSSLFGQKYYALGYFSRNQNMVCGKYEIAVNKEIDLGSISVSEYQKQFQNELYTRYAEKNISERKAIVVSPKQVLIVYAYKTRPDKYWDNCVTDGISHIVANTIKEAEGIYNARKENPQVSSMNELFRWQGNANEVGKPGLTANYEGVKVEYTRLRNGSVLAKGTNTNTDVIAVIRFKTNGGSEIETIEVPPGGGFQKQVDESDYNLEISFKPGANTGAGTLEKVKKLIKDNIKTSPNGEIRNNTTGVRG
ncbi:hypothetical protein SAMN03080617_00342 [Algoriphagus alkaliphilus]|uniref:Uncharacterized protein n=1 Tax=Algoriphagus alkaliphilus TaxID=279824 RepID=A0A1G5V8B6_9BACT|nr:hypothetical protein [Algoriphagus alkaliphilus]MBA4300886.1 hypothetical protein [Cyclobacterium sp.]SDA42079.1 hypothetical protein SAMN03080617_00342 [Algoriphagus alkaliphilus]